MSNKRKKVFGNPYLYREFQNNPVEMFDFTMTNIMDNFYDSALNSATEGMFEAICLSGARTEQPGGDGADSFDAKKVGDHMTIVVRPLTPFGDMLPDPARLPDEDSQKVYNAIAIHAGMFVATSDFKWQDHSPIVFGQIVKCYYDEGSITNSNFEGLRFAEPAARPSIHPSYKALGAVEPTGDAKSAFNNKKPRQLGQPAVATSNEDIEGLAARFDSEPSNYKARNSGLISQAHPEFQNYIKAFITKSKDNNITIYLNSTHRSRAGQDKLIAEHARGERKIKPAEYSYHLVGLAFDFNPVLSTGEWVKSTASKQQWINTGIVAIGESLGLRWGGYFSTNYDPVHFDLGNSVSKTRMKSMVAEANKKGVEGTQIPTNIKPKAPPPLPSLGDLQAKYANKTMYFVPGEMGPQTGEFMADGDKFYFKWKDSDGDNRKVMVVK